MNILKKIINTKKNPTSEYVGYIDSISAGYVNGWVYKKNTMTPLEVTLWINGSKASSVLANEERRDVSWVHNCSESCGFSLPIPLEKITSSSFSYEVIVGHGEDSTSIPTAPTIKMDENNVVKISEDVYNLINLKRHIVSQLSHIPEALISLNNNSEIRLSGVDPHLAQIIIVNGAEGTATELFRTYPLAQCLKDIGYSALIFGVQDIPYIKHDKFLACIFVRVAANATVVDFINKIRKNGTKIIADFDDLVFRPSLLNKIDGIRFLTSEQVEAYGNGMHLYREMIRISDQAWFTTKRLNAEAIKINENCKIIGNFPIEAARSAASLVHINSSKSEFIIGYYSGTLTHQADFKVCYKSLAEFLIKYGDAKLRIVGRFDITEFPEISTLHNVEHYPIMDYSSMIRNMAECSVVLAPLVIGDEFCESKSELKFFDAALVYVPVIASATEPYRDCILDYENGYLAKNSNDWFIRLESAYQRPVQRKNIALKAYETIQKKYARTFQIDNYIMALNEIGVVPPSSPTTKIINPENLRKLQLNPKRLAVLLPDIMIGSGGHRKVLAFCNEYALRGGLVEVIFLSSRSDQELNSIVKNNYFTDCGSIRAYSNIEPSADVVVATSWQTCYIVEKWRESKKYYFVQDFEPLFSAMSTDFALAYNTYKMGFKIIPFGRWNSKKLEVEFGISEVPIDFPIDREVYFQDSSIIRSQNTILFYARPSQPRRLFELGNAAILMLRSLLPNWKFIYYGEDIALPHHQGIEYAGKKTDLRELRRLYSSSTIGVAFSTTNPSLIPFEMLSCGLPVVDVNISSFSPDFDGCESIIYSRPTVDDLAKTIFQLAINKPKLSEMSDKATLWASERISESEFSRIVLSRMNLI
jgi:glycosyltransferase involved in cell wall biosynthesis